MSASNNQTVKAYNIFAQDYIATTPPLSGKWQAWLDNNLAAMPKNARILEIGSASGRDAAYMEAKGYAVERTDVTQAFVDYLRSQGYQAQTLNLLTDTLPSDLDMVYAQAVLVHFTPSETQSVLRKVFGALKPSGRFAFSLKQGDGDEVTGKGTDVERYFCYWQVPDIEHELKAAGFQTVSHDFNDDHRPGKPRWILLTAIRGSEA